MGAFFILPRQIEIPEDVLGIFKKKEFSKPLISEWGDFSVVLYKKQLVDQFQLAELNSSRLLAVGTCFYKSFEYFDGLKEILKDYSFGKLEVNELRGSFFILLWHQNELHFLSDRAGIQNIFFHAESRVASSSFLATMVGASILTKKLKVNKTALTEILCTGNLMGPETQIEGITRFETAIHNHILDIDIIDIAYQGLPENKLLEEVNPVDEQIGCIEGYFSKLKMPLQNWRVLSGLTGGFDSRLLYLLFRKYISNYRLYCTTRQNAKKEQILAGVFATQANEKLSLPEYRSYTKMSSQELSTHFTSNLYFNDGILRTFQIWLEEIKSREYLIYLYGNERLGLSGVGGEAYRNANYLLAKSYGIKRWIKNEILFRVSGNCFTDRNSRAQIVQNISLKIKELLKLSPSEGHLSRDSIKRYYNEVWNSSNRTVRNNIENQLVFFLSPFTDYYVSNFAYRAIPHLGLSHRFEKEMIERLNPELASIVTSYGYSINRPVRLKYPATTLIKWLLGLKLYNYFYFRLRSKGQIGISRFLDDNLEMMEYVNRVKQLKLPLNIDKLISNDFLSPLLIETGIFLEEMKDYIEHD